MLKVKIQHFGHQTLILGKIEGERRRADRQ